MAVRSIKTGLGKKYKDMLDSVIGQMSDGYWEDTPMMRGYWKFVKTGTSGNEVTLNVDETSGARDGDRRIDNRFYGMSDDAVKKFFADKIKFLIKEEGLGKWDRGNENETDFLSYGEPRYRVKDCYYAYEILKGRDARKHPEYGDVAESNEGANKSYTFTWWDNEPAADRRPITWADLKNCLHKEIFLAVDDAEALKLAMEYLCDYTGDDPKDVADTPEEIWDYFNGDWGSGDPIPMVLKQRSRVVKDSGFVPREGDDESHKADGARTNEAFDGWDGWEEIEGLEDALYDIEDLAYELRSCVRGAKTRCKDWKSLALYIKGLASNLEDAAGEMKYRQDESKKEKGEP